MGNRYVLSGVQLTVIITTLRASYDFINAVIKHKLIDYPNTAGFGNPKILRKSIKDEIDKLEELSNKQSIGNSQNKLSHDIFYLKNLFASWLGKTE